MGPLHQGPTRRWDIVRRGVLWPQCLAVRRSDQVTPNRNPLPSTTGPKL